MAHDEHCTVGPAKTLFLEIQKGIRHQAATIANRNINSLITTLKDAKSKFSILSDTPFRPADILQYATPHHCHGAVLNNGIAFISVDHADMEKALVLGLAHRLESIVTTITVVLRSLNNRCIFIIKERHQVCQPLGGDLIIAVDNGDHFRLWSGFSQSKIERACFKPFQWRNVKEAETLTQQGAMLFNGLPHGRISGIVVDYQDFEIGVVDLRQSIEGLFQHLRRLIVSRHMNRDERLTS